MGQAQPPGSMVPPPPLTPPPLPLVLPNPATSYLPYSAHPRVHPSCFLAPGSVVAGDVSLAANAFVGFGAVVRGDWGPVYIGPLCNLHDLVTVHQQPYQAVKVGAYRFGVHLDGEVSVLHKASLHGPCRIGRNTFIGQMANIFDAEIGADCVVLHGAIITGGVKVPAGRLVLPGRVIETQAAANDLEPVPGEWESVNAATVRGYYELGRGYGAILAAACAAAAQRDPGPME